MTIRLYYQDPYIKTFEATMIQIGHDDRGSYVVLDRTAFYPTGGGQPHDIGRIGQYQVCDVEEVDGQIRHYVSNLDDIPLPFGPVSSEIDWQRRFDFMQQHCGQHILSAAFDERFGAETIGFHLGKEVVTIDINHPELTAQMVEEVERLVDSVIFENREVTACFVEPEVAAAMPLRKQPTVQENIRIVTVEGFDYNPCGGTHPSRTAEVGAIHITGWERYKGNVRVSFVCGGRTRSILQTQRAIVKQVCLELSTNESGVSLQAARVLQERNELEEQLQKTRTKLLELEANDVARAATQWHGHRLIALAFEGRPMQELQSLAKLITTDHPSSIVLFASKNEKVQLVFSRGADSTVDVSQLLKKTLEPLGGKGGGNPAMAQGGGMYEGDLNLLLTDALALLENHFSLLS